MSGQQTIAICMPVRDRIELETEFALSNNVSFEYDLLTEVGLPVDEARNRLTKRALASGVEQVVWADADAFWLPGCLERMLSWTSDPTKAIGSVYGARMHFSTASARPIFDPHRLVSFEEIRAMDGLIPCDFIGSHVLACSDILLERLGPRPWALRDTDSSEDAAFARRIREAGCGLYLDTRAWTFHVENGVMYVPGSSAYALVDGRVEIRPLPPTAPFQRARDYGAVVNAARWRPGTMSRPDERRAFLGEIQAKVQTKPVYASRFRVPTEDELSHFSEPGP